MFVSPEQMSPTELTHVHVQLNDVGQLYGVVEIGPCCRNKRWVDSMFLAGWYAADRVHSETGQWSGPDAVSRGMQAGWEWEVTLWSTVDLHTVAYCDRHWETYCGRTFVQMSCLCSRTVGMIDPNFHSTWRLVPYCTSLAAAEKATRSTVSPVYSLTQQASTLSAKLQLFIMAALCNRGAIIFLPCSFFFLPSIFFFFLA